MIETWKAWVMLAFGTLIGSVLTYVLPWPLLFGPSDKNWVDTTTALGTVAAVGVAVAIALRDARWRRQAQESEALIAWGVVANEVRRLRDDLSAAKQVAMSWRPSFVRNHRVYLGGIDEIYDVNPSFPSEVIYKLAYLPDGIGGVLAGALGLLPGIEVQMTRLRGGSEELKVAQTHAIRWIEQAVNNLDHVLKWADGQS